MSRRPSHVVHVPALYLAVRWCCRWLNTYDMSRQRFLLKHFFARNLSKKHLNISAPCGGSRFFVRTAGRHRRVLPENNLGGLGVFLLPVFNQMVGVLIVLSFFGATPHEYYYRRRPYVVAVTWAVHGIGCFSLSIFISAHIPVCCSLYAST